MGKLIMWNIITLDGYFEGNQSWDLPFHLRIWGPELEAISLEQLGEAEALVFGKVTYEGMESHWTQTEGAVADYMNSIKKIVCSTTLDSTRWNNSTLVKNEIPEFIRKLKAQSKKDLYVFGSADLSQTLIREGLFDEFRIGVAPVILGQGRHLFEKGLPEIPLELTKSITLSNGGVVLRFIPSKAPV